MNSTIINSYVNEPAPSTSALSKFFTWCSNQEHNRFGWTGAILALHGCVFTPLTMFAIILSGNSMFFWVLALVAMGASLITNLAAMPTKITLPVFFFTILMDVIIIASCLAIGFDIAKTYI